MFRLIIVFLALCIVPARAQSITGQWRTIDDATGKPRSVVEIYERDGAFFGKVARIFPFPGEDPDPVCTECSESDPRFGKKVIGMEILKSLQRKGKEFADGRILDPGNGRIYDCKVWLENGKLKLRGYVGPFYRTQTWERMP